MINLLTLFYSFSGLVPGTRPHSQLNKLGDKDLCCVGVETLNHLQYSVHVCNPQNVININHEVSLEKDEHNVGDNDSRRDFGSAHVSKKSLDFVRIKLFRC